MSSDKHDESWTFVEHNRAEQRRESYWDRNEDVKDTIRKCARAIERGQRKHYRYVGTKMQDVLVPLLLDQQDKWPEDYDDPEKLADHEYWFFDALSTFVEATDAVLRPLEPDSPHRRAADESLALQVQGYDDEEAAARVIVHRAFKSLSAIAEYEHVIKDALKSRVDAVGLSGMKLGINKQDAERDLGDPVDLIVEESGKVTSLYAGSPGSGKSTAAEAQFEDYYRLNFTEGRANCKCIDVAETSVGESVFYDTPQQQDDLREVREDKDLPPDFLDDEDFDPQQEVYVPLTPNLSKQKLPYDEEADEFVPTPFIIPASEISKELFTTVITARVSDRERKTIQSVYEAVDRDQSDWTFDDMVQEIVDRDELSDKHKKAAINALRSLQDMGFIRRRGGNDEFDLDWREIFTDTDTVTVFNQSLVPSESAQTFVIAWLVEKIWEWRKENHHYPQMAMYLRELWELVPHNQRDSDSETTSALQERIAKLLSKILRKHRDIRAHVLADTQFIMDIHSGVRSGFKRYAMFDGNDRIFKNVFSWTSNSKWGAFKGTISSSTGEASVVGQVGPAINERGIEFVGPVEMVPPSFHHHDKDEGSGWRARAHNYVETETLEYPEDWPVEVPEDLKIDPPSEYEGEDGEMGDETYDVKEAHQMMARNRRENGESVRDIREAIPNNPETGKPYSVYTIQEWTKDIYQKKKRERQQSQAEAD